MTASAAERWAPYPGWGDLYEVSTLGRILSLRSGRVLKPYTDKETGYQIVTLTRMVNGRQVRKAVRVHVLVLETHVGPRPVGLVGCHGPAGVSDNSVTNLRWDTQRENVLDVIRAGRNFELRKTHCKNGHEFNAENTYFDQKRKRRQCKVCRRLTDKNRVRQAA